jgi:hypothetical protein
MNAPLTLWTADAELRPRPLAEGRVPHGVDVVVLAARAPVPAGARLELTAGTRRFVPPGQGGAGAWVWPVERVQLAGASRWLATLRRGAETLATLWIEVEAAPSGPLRVEAVLRDGARRPADGAEAGKVERLVISADLGADTPPGALGLRVEGPGDRRQSLPTVLTLAGGTGRVDAAVPGGAFVDGLWTLSVFRERTLVRRARVRLLPSALGVRTATLLVFGPDGLRVIVGPRVDPADLARRLVFAYELDGLQLGARTVATLSLRDADGASFGAWEQTVDRSDPAALARVWIPVPRRLDRARLPLVAELDLDGTLAHARTLDVPAATSLRSDGTLLEIGPATPGDAGARAFFGLPEPRPARRRRRASGS